jgi:hypothetical protein
MRIESGRLGASAEWAFGPRPEPLHVSALRASIPAAFAPPAVINASPCLPAALRAPLALRAPASHARCAAPVGLAPFQQCLATRSTVGHGPLHGLVPWWGSIDACELPFLFSPSEPPPALGKMPAPVVRQPAALSRHKRPPEKPACIYSTFAETPVCHTPVTFLSPAWAPSGEAAPKGRTKQERRQHMQDINHPTTDDAGCSPCTPEAHQRSVS